MLFPDPILNIKTYLFFASSISISILVALRLKRLFKMWKSVRHQRTAAIAPAPVQHSRNPTHDAPASDIAQSFGKAPKSSSSQDVTVLPAISKHGNNALHDQIGSAPTHRTDEKHIQSINLIKPPPRDVEFYVVFPKEVSNRNPFTVYVCVANYKPPARSESVDAKAAPESLVALVPNRGFVSVVLESDGLDVDAPFQSLMWTNRDTVAGFVLHPTKLNQRSICKNQVWICVDGIVRGTIKFQIEVDPSLRSSAAKPTVVDRTDQITNSISQQILQLLTTEGSRAQVVRSAFICYSHQDWFRVSYLAESLEAAGINVWIDALKMKRQPDWETQAKGYIETADLAYVCWSPAAASSDAILQKELKWIKQRLDNQGIKQSPAREQGTFDAILVKLEDSVAPQWLEVDDGKFSKRWQIFRAGMREQYGMLRTI